jgi:hypothetical protein
MKSIKRYLLTFILALSLILVIVAPVFADTMLLGTTTIGDSNFGANYVTYQRFQASGSGTINSISVYVLVSGNVKVGIYTDNSAAPGTLIGYNNGSTAVTSTAWRNVALTNTCSVTSGTYYWIAALIDTSGASTYSAGGGSNNNAYESRTYATGLPATAGATLQTVLGAYQAYGSSAGMTVVTVSSSSVEATTATTTENITAMTGSIKSTKHGTQYGTNSTTYGSWDNTTADVTSAPYPWNDSLTSLSTGTTYYYRGFATDNNSVDYFGSQLNFLTKPAAPGNVVASDGTYTDKVRITWDNSVGATAYHVWKDGGDLGAQTSPYDDTTAGSPTITAGTATATDGTFTDKVTLTVSGQSASNGATSTYYVVASNATGNSANSTSNTGYRGTTTLTYAWYVSAGDSDASYGAIGGGTTNPYDYTSAPAPTITGGTASATDGTSSTTITLSIAGASGNNGAGRYYKCNISMSGASPAYTSVDRGYTGITTLTYAWKVSAADSDASYGAIGGGTTTPYDYASGPAPTITPGTATASDGTFSYVLLSIAGQTGNNGAGRYFYCTISMSGASNADTTHDRGYLGTTTLTYQWWRSAADSDAGFSSLAGATTAPYNDTTGAVSPDGRYYYCVVSMSGAADQNTTHDRGNKLAFASPTVVTYPCTGFTKVQAVLNGKITAQGDAAVSQYGFDYGLTTSYGSSIVTATAIANNIPFWKAPTTLLPGTIYHFRAKAYNGAWGYGSDMTFSTVGSPVLYESLTSGQDGNSDNITANSWGYMQFIANAVAHTVTSLQVYIKKAGTGTIGTCTIGLFHATAGTPTGNALASTTFSGDAISASYQFYTFNITETPIQGGLQYAIVIAAPNASNPNCIQWGVVNAGALANAVYGMSTNGGLSWTTGSPKDALFGIWGNPSILVTGANVFTGFKTTGDWLIVADVSNFYLPYYPNNDVSLYFQLQLVDGTTVKATSPFVTWKRSPLSIYMSPTTVTSLAWGSGYKIRIQLLSDPTVYSEYVLQSTDWQGGAITLLDSYIRTTASVMQDYYTTLNGTATVFLVAGTGGNVLNTDGGTLFNNGISGLMVQRPNLFQTYVSSVPTPVYPTNTNVADANIIMSDRLGTVQYGLLVGFSSMFGVTPIQLASTMIWLLFLICGIWTAADRNGGGSLLGGLICGTMIIGIGLMFGAVSWMFMLQAGFCVAALIAFRVFIQNLG